MSDWLRLLKHVASVVIPGLRRRDVSDVGPYIPHAPPLTGEPSGYVEEPLEPMGEWPGTPQDVDYIPPKPPKGGGE